MTFSEMLENLDDEEMVIVPEESEENIGIKSVLKIVSIKINIIIGPEGGFAEGEIELLKEINSHIVTLGPRILRTETAGFTTTAVYELRFREGLMKNL